MSPISSRKMVPPSAMSNFPGLKLVAPVKAPFSWPNNSLSSRSSGMAAQLSLIKGLSCRLLWSWILAATNSLPVPLSPKISTVESVGDTFLIKLSNPRIARLSPIIPGKKWRASMRLSTEVTWSKTLVNCWILSTDQSFFTAFLAPAKVGNLLASFTNFSIGFKISRTSKKPDA